MKNTKAPEDYVMVSFDVVSLFTNVPLKQTIEIILKKVYDERLIKTKIPRKRMEKLLYLCTQGTPFTFNEKMYVQVDGVMMGSPLGALFANIFMCELENTLVPRMGDRLLHWMRYVDDTFAFVKPNQEQEIQQVLNSFHENIQFTYENEQSDRIAFLDVSVSRGTDGKLETNVYRKPTNTDVYMNWDSYAPSTWKIATLKSLIKRAFMISSTQQALDAELQHIKKVFVQYNNYPIQLLDNIIENETKEHAKEEQNEETEQDPPEEQNPTEEQQTVTLCLPYAGEKGEQIVKKLKKNIQSLSQNAKVNIIYTAQKLGSKFQVKDKTKIEHIHNVVYHGKCPNKKCESEYTGQTKCRMLKRTTQHNKTDEKSHLLIHAKETRHRRIWLKDFKILGKGYKSDFKRRISESLFIKKLKPDLNVQMDAYRLTLFN